jgi:hypothetical protein
VSKHRSTSQREHATWWYAVLGVVVGLLVACGCIISWVVKLS